MNWKEYWKDYRSAPATNEDELFVQVALTIGGRPIAKADFSSQIAQIFEGLSLSSEDFVVDLCCGNGLFTQPIAKKVRKVIGVDCTPQRIEDALRFRNHENVSYLVEDVMDYLESAEFSEGETKVLISNSLAYFSPEEVDRMLGLLARASRGSYRLLATGIPSEDLQGNFYNTPERIARHRRNVASGDESNDGLGRWWKRAELEKIASQNGMNLEVIVQPSKSINYRLDARIF